jgi:hypothetical protein
MTLVMTVTIGKEINCMAVVSSTLWLSIKGKNLIALLSKVPPPPSPGGFSGLVSHRRVLPCVGPAQTGPEVAVGFIAGEGGHWVIAGGLHSFNRREGVDDLRRRPRRDLDCGTPRGEA